MKYRQLDFEMQILVDIFVVVSIIAFKIIDKIQKSKAEKEKKNLVKKNWKKKHKK